MANPPIILNVHIEAAAGREEDLAEHWGALIEPTRKEPGCITYRFHRDPSDPKMFMFYEEFADQEALDAHVASPHFQKVMAYRANGNDPIASQTVTRWSEVEASTR